VISAAQLNKLNSFRGPNDDPPADTSIGQVVPQGCSQLITPSQMYAYDPNLSGLANNWTPAAGTAAAQAQTWNGVACQWIRETGNVSLTLSVANIVDPGTLAQLQTTAQAGAPVTGLGDSAYYANGELQIFRGTYWVDLNYPWTEQGSDFFPLPQDVLAALP
jgi:hypothetical protein